MGKAEDAIRDYAGAEIPIPTLSVMGRVESQPVSLGEPLEIFQTKNKATIGEAVFL